MNKLPKFNTTFFFQKTNLFRDFHLFFKSRKLYELDDSLPPLLPILARIETKPSPSKGSGQLHSRRICLGG